MNERYVWLTDRQISQNVVDDTSNRSIFTNICVKPWKTIFTFSFLATLTSTMLSQLLLSSGSAVFSSTKLEVYTAFLFRENRSHRTHRLGATLCGLGRSSESTTETHELAHWCYSAVSQLSCLWAKNVKGQQFKVYQNQHGSNFIIMLQLRLK